MIIKWGSTFPQTREIPGPTEQNKMIKEKGKVALVTAFYLANEGDSLNFNLIKEYLFYVKIENILPVLFNSLSG